MALPPPGARNVPPSTTSETDVVGRRTAFILAFVLSPITLWLLFVSVISQQSVAATGLPLGSPGGQLGMLLATVGLLIISQTARWSSTGFFTLAGWSGAFYLFLTVRFTAIPLPPLAEGDELLFWCRLPLLVFVIALGAGIATRRVRRLASQEPPVAPTPSADQDPHSSQISTEKRAWPLTILCVLIASVIAALILSIAPRTSEPLILHRPDLYLNTSTESTLVVLLAAAALFVLTWLAGFSVVSVQVGAWAVLLLPGLVVIPLIVTSAELMPTPENEPLVALSFALPVVGAVGAVVAATTHVLLVLSKHEDDSGAF
ncbi:MAG: hypothetical protein Q4P06_05665 [Actinomycetaceae bacterium]|nr:hypothetical protein [Actinomycetaceae bacterium]